MVMAGIIMDRMQTIARNAVSISIEENAPLEQAVFLITGVHINLVVNSLMVITTVGKGLLMKENEMRAKLEVLRQLHQNSSNWLMPGVDCTTIYLCILFILQGKLF